MTWRDLSTKLSCLPSEELDNDVTVYFSEVGEFFSIKELLKVEEGEAGSDVIGPGAYYLSDEDKDED